MRMLRLLLLLWVPAQCIGCCQAVNIKSTEQSRRVARPWLVLWAIAHRRQQIWQWQQNWQGSAADVVRGSMATVVLAVRYCDTTWCHLLYYCNCLRMLSEPRPGVKAHNVLTRRQRLPQQ